MKIKEKYLIMAVIIGVCTGDISGNCVWAADASQQTEKNSDSNDSPESGNSEEEQAYQKFLNNCVSHSRYFQ